MEASTYLLCADFLLVLHFAFVLFVVGGFVAVWIGYFAGWRFIRNFYLRLAHLLAMGYVAFEALVGVACPLTVWERRLRELGGQAEIYQGSFIAHWLQRIIFYELDQSVFALLYTILFLVFILTLWKIPPRRFRSKGHM